MRPSSVGERKRVEDLVCATARQDGTADDLSASSKRKQCSNFLHMKMFMGDDHFIPPHL